MNQTPKATTELIDIAFTIANPTTKCSNIEIPLAKIAFTIAFPISELPNIKIPSAKIAFTIAFPIPEPAKTAFAIAKTTNERVNLHRATLNSSIPARASTFQRIFSISEAEPKLMLSGDA